MEIILRIISVQNVVHIIRPDLGRHHLTKVMGTPLFGRKMKSNGVSDEITIIRAGIFDDIGILNERKPEAEIYTNRRVKWMSPVEGADQFGGTLPLP